MKRENKIFLIGIVFMLILMLFSTLLLYFPTNVINIIYYGIGIILGLVGIIEIISFIIKLNKSKPKYLAVFISVICILLAVLVILKKDFLVSWLNIVVGITIVLFECLLLQLSFKLKKQDNKNYFIIILITFINILLGIILITNPLNRILKPTTQTISIIIFMTSLINIIKFTIFKMNYKKEEIE